MRGPTDPDDKVPSTPFPVSPVSNGEWVPLAVTKTQALAAKLIAEEADVQAKRHGMSRAQFLKTAAGTAIAFSVLNRLHGLDAWGDNAMLPVKKVHCEDPEAAREFLDKDQYFIVDVQTHHADTGAFPPSFFCFLRFLQEAGDPSCSDDPSVLGDLNYIREMLIDSETDVAVLSGLPSGVPLGPEKMLQTRDLANQLAASERCVSQAVIDANFDNRTIPAPDASTRLDTLEHQVNMGARAIKTYTYNGNWRLDDETIAYPMYAEAERLGIKLINCHKGLPAIFAPGSEESVRTIDIPKAVADWPKLRFCAYHSGYFQTGNHPEGKDGISEFVEVLEGMPKKHRTRVYAEIGSTFAITLLGDGGVGGMQTGRFIGQLLKTLGSKNILWGTDSIWWGSPQWLIDAFKNLQMPASLLDEGFPQIKKRDKQRIFGKNAAKLYGIKRTQKRCTIPEDALGQMQVAMGGPRANRSLHVYGARSRREFLQLFGWHYG